MTIEPWVVFVVAGILLGGSSLAVIAILKRRQDRARLQRRLRQAELIGRSTFKQEIDDLDGAYLEDNSYES